MRFYPTADINHYWEIPSAWSLYCRNPHKTWKRTPLQAENTIAYWRDLKGAKMPAIMKNYLYFKQWPSTRIRPEACLPIYYCVGNRFILIEKAFPASFKCAELPMNLKERRDLKMYKKEEDKYQRAKAKEAKKLAREKKKLEIKKKKQRGEIKT